MFKKKIFERFMKFNKFLTGSKYIYSWGVPDLSKAHTEEGILLLLDQIIHANIEMTKILNHSPDSIYVADKEGKTVFANEAFLHTTGVPLEEVIGRTVFELEEAGYYKPSVLRLVKEEKRKVTVLQTGRNGKQIVVKGVPVFDEDGNIDMLLSNAKLVDEVRGIYSYFNEINRSSDTVSYSNISMIGESREIAEILELVHQIKDTDSTVLISGESGVGKSVLARYIHENSNRAKKKMVEINCGAIPENLLESELFGYESGAFTGASATGKEGLIEVADGGTLLLDEISELPLMLQVKLLKVLQDRQIMRIGGKVPIDVDVRVIAASNKKLGNLMREGKFREDLFYRLNVIPIEIPPLRHRKEDLVLSAKYFLKRHQEKYNKEAVFTDEFLQGILDYGWPGNMRELENYIERMILTNRSGVIGMSDVPSGENGRSKSGDVLHDAALSGEMTLSEALEKVEKQIVIDTYKKYPSSYKTAEILGISQASAFRKIKKYVNDKRI